MNSLKDRFTRIAEYYGISIRKLEAKCGLQRGNISNTTGAIGSDKLAKIFVNCPEVDLVWLITGQGEMLKSQPDVLEHSNNKELLDRIERLSAENALLRRDIENLKNKDLRRNNEDNSNFPRTVAADTELRKELK